MRKFLTFIGKPFFLLLVFLAPFVVSFFLLVYKAFRKITLPPLPRISVPAVILLVLLGWFLILKDLPKPGELVTRDRIVSTKIYDRNGGLLFKIFRNQNRTPVKLDQVPLYLRQATIAIEDADFYAHLGFSVRGMLRATVRNLTRGELTGGSTITQQLVKNALLTPEKTLTRKVREIILALQVEIAFSKDQILEMYLNEVAYGGAAYGVEEASVLYFAKSAAELTLAEAALLAGLPKAPTTYSPFGANPALAKARQLEVLARMVQEDYISQEEAEKAAKSDLVFAPQRTDIKAPHFVMYVKQLLAQKYGERMVEEGGLEVQTTLDPDIQELAEKVVFEETAKIKRLRISNGAALVTDPATGEILAMVGSRDYFDTGIEGNFNVTTAQRQPGSAIKPVMYALAIASGRFTPATILSDTPITYHVPGTESYSPKNYDGHFRGKVPLRLALGSSLNVPAVKTLHASGVDNMIEQGNLMGITTWNQPSRFGLSLTLGGGEVKMIDLATAYGTLANYGQKVNLDPIIKVTDHRGKVLEENKCLSAAEAALREGCGTPVVDPQVAFILTDILRDNNARIPAFGPNSLLVIPGHPEVAVKTGTTQNLRDNWAIGYTKKYVVAAWVGNNDNTPMAWVASGVTGATPIWHKIMRGLLEPLTINHQPSTNPYWEEPEEIVKVAICSATGTLPCEGCPSVRTEYFVQDTQPKNACSKEQFEKKEENQPAGQEGQILSF